MVRPSLLPQLGDRLARTRAIRFYIAPSDVKAALLELRGELLTFTDEPVANEWRQSETTRTLREMPSPPG